MKKQIFEGLPPEENMIVQLDLLKYENAFLHKTLNDLSERIKELKKTISEVKTLRGFLPICANCKKIRNDEGYWQDVAVYIRDHSEVEFTHGICPNCTRELYSEFYKGGGE